MKIERYTYPDALYYDRHHAYARVGDDVVVQGITDLGQGLVGEVFFVELPYVGRRVKQGDLLLSIQPMAVRARACRVYATVSGEVVAVNAALEMAPEPVNDDPYGMGWIVKIRPDDVLELQGEL
ncbi:MAG: glycine cleavage system protein H, partial [Anaerolineae bacterium]|nr:glycine cleavage system protein H [Anaerolineae bacterium]